MTTTRKPITVKATDLRKGDVIVSGDRVEVMTDPVLNEDDGRLYFDGKDARRTNPHRIQPTFELEVLR